MSAAREPVQRAAARLDTAVIHLAGHRLTISWLALVLTTVLGATYLIFGSLQADPFRSTYEVRVRLAESGGLQPDRDVTVRGVRVGQVKSVDIADGVVVAVAAIDRSAKIPVDRCDHRCGPDVLAGHAGATAR